MQGTPSGPESDELDVNRSSFYQWYRRFEAEGYDGLATRKSVARKFWNKIPDKEKDQVVSIALEHPGKSPRELAWHITDSEGYYLSESSVYRILKAKNLITSPAYIVLAAAGAYTVTFQPSHLAIGVYYARLSTSIGTETTKLLNVK